MSNYFYIILPFIAWGVAGTLKFIINIARFGSGISLIGNGGFPSTHTTVVAAVVFFIGFSDGFCTPYFLLGMTLLWVVINDAFGLRRAVGRHARYLNEISKGEFHLRERQGHEWYEILGGLLLGGLIGYIASSFY